jgi:hypothetical protein
MHGRLTLLLAVCALLFAALGGVALAAGAPKLTVALAYSTGKGENDQVWLANPNGSHAVKLGRGDQPLVSPNGAMVAAALLGPKGPSIAIYTPGQPTAKYFDLTKASGGPASWSPDSRYIAINLSSTAVHGNAGAGLAVIDTQSGTVKMLATGFICGASFAPSAPDRLVFAHGQDFCSKQTNVYTIAVDGTGLTQLTHDGHSLDPLWGKNVIAFDRSTPRRNNAPVYQIWTMHADGTHATQITHMKIPLLVSGLTPIAFSAGGNRLLAEFVGQDTEQAWTVTLASHRVHEVKVNGQFVLPGGISSDGRQLLIDFGGFEGPPHQGTVETVPFAGGSPTVLVKHAAEPTWNR